MTNKLSGYELIGYFNAFETSLKILPSNGSGSRTQNKEVQSRADTLRKIERVDFSEIEKSDQTLFLRQIESVKAHLYKNGKDVFKRTFLDLTSSDAAKSSIDRMIVQLDKLCQPLKEADLDRKAKYLERLRICDPADAADIVQEFQPYHTDQKFLIEAAKILAKEFPEVLINNLHIFPLKNLDKIFVLWRILPENYRNPLAQHFGISSARMKSEIEKFEKGRPALEQSIQFEGICFGVTMAYCSPDPSKRTLSTARFIQNVHSVQIHQYNENYQEKTDPLQSIHATLPQFVRNSLKIKKEESITLGWKPFAEFDEILKKLREIGGQYAITIYDPANNAKHAIYINFDTFSFCDPGENYKPILYHFKDAEELTYEFRRHWKFTLSNNYSMLSVCRIPVTK